MNSGKNSVKIGNMYGTWKVIEVECINPKSQAKRKRKGAFCQCQCGCDTIQFMEYRQLYDGRTKGCSKIAHQATAEARMKNATIPNGTKFGYLEVIQDLGMNNYKHPKRTYLCKCKCGNEIKVVATHLISRHVLSCGCIHSSLGEQIIEEILKDNDIQYIKEYSFKDLISEKGGLYRFDFAIFENDKLIKLIEFDGIQHYQEGQGYFSKVSLAERQLNDRIKDNYCKEHNYNLLRIPYWDMNKIDLKYLGLEENSEEDQV